MLLDYNVLRAGFNTLIWFCIYFQIAENANNARIILSINNN